ncbi:hypothetical protein HWI79_1750 [Cryptosporidium felis]|nr:hypothetical protein HWI79_1750 [Cryptosporidium felis]
MTGEVSLINKNTITSEDESSHTIKSKRKPRELDCPSEGAFSRSDEFSAVLGDQNSANETENEVFCIGKSQISSSVRALSDSDGLTEKSLENVSEVHSCEQAFSRKESLEGLEWSGEERVFFQEARFPLSNIDFYSNWRNLINQQEAPRTPQFKAKGVFPVQESFSDSDEYSSYSSSCSSESLQDIQKDVSPLKKDHLQNKVNCRRISGISWNQYEGSSSQDSNDHLTSPSLQISHSLGGRSRFGLLLTQWMSYFSGRQSIEICDIEYATQFFMGLDNAALATVTSSLIYIGHCARYTQIRRYNES